MKPIALTVALVIGKADADDTDEYDDKAYDFLCMEYLMEQEHAGQDAHHGAPSAGGGIYGKGQVGRGIGHKQEGRHAGADAHVKY